MEGMRIRKKRTASEIIDEWDAKKPTDGSTYNVTNIQNKKGARVLLAAQIKLVEVSDKGQNSKKLKLFFRSTSFDPQTIKEYGDDPLAKRTILIVKVLKESRQLYS